MPRIYRVMTLDHDGFPKVGPTKRCLGVKPGSGRFDDIEPDEDGNVLPQSGGMSVAPAWQDLPMHRIPHRLESKARDAAGKDQDYCWRMGAGPFMAELIATDLVLRPDPVDKKKGRVIHGCVEPALKMSLERLQHLLAQTRSEWVIDEE